MGGPACVFYRAAQFSNGRLSKPGRKPSGARSARVPERSLSQTDRMAPICGAALSCFKRAFATRCPYLSHLRMRQVQAVIFDMDGVIVDSEPLHERAFLEVVREIGYADRLKLRFADYIGRSDQEFWTDFVALHNPPQPAEDLLVRKRHRMVEIIRREKPLFDGVPTLVRKLAGRYALALASGSERMVVAEVLKLQSLKQLFSVVVTASEIQNGKPAPDIFLRTAEQLQVPPRGCCVIEDSKPGIAAGLAAGMQVIAIANTHPAAELRHATHVLRTYEEIERLLLEAH